MHRHVARAAPARLLHQTYQSTPTQRQQAAPAPCSSSRLAWLSSARGRDSGRDRCRRCHSTPISTPRPWTLRTLPAHLTQSTPQLRICSMSPAEWPLAMTHAPQPTSGCVSLLLLLAHLLEEAHETRLPSRHRRARSLIESKSPSQRQFHYHQSSNEQFLSSGNAIKAQIQPPDKTIRRPILVDMSECNQVGEACWWTARPWTNRDESRMA